MLLFRWEDLHPIFSLLSAADYFPPSLRFHGLSQPLHQLGASTILTKEKDEGHTVIYWLAIELSKCVALQYSKSATNFLASVLG